MSNRRLIEVAFPLKQTSLDSVHEKMCHSGHIKALHIWPARRPLAACRAALIATLLPDPGNEEERRAILERMGGRINPDTGKTVGGILHWKRESRPALDEFREQIREAYGGRAPRVLDPFAGGGAIPLEAMRLGCEATAVDINPVAWFILKCTLEYPQKLAGKTRPLPEFILDDRDFMETFFKKAGDLTGAALRAALQEFFSGEAASLHLPGLDIGADVHANLAWHVRAWGQWVLDRAREDLAPYYPIINDKPAIAYLWARTATCKNCRGVIPLLKTTWLAKKGRKKRVVLELSTTTDYTDHTDKKEKSVRSVPSVDFSIRKLDPTEKAGKEVGKGIMSRSGATCPHCGAIMTMEDLRTEGQAGRLGKVMTAVVVDGESGKEFRLPTEEEKRISAAAEDALDEVFAEIPFGLPDEPTPAGGGSGASRAFSVQNYGMMQWRDLFTSRQLLALGTYAKHTRALYDVMQDAGYPVEWREAVGAYLACVINKVADYNSALVAWQPRGLKGSNTFQRWALPIKWDFVENNTLEGDSGGWANITAWVTKPLRTTLLDATRDAPNATIVRDSAMHTLDKADVILTDPPYYDAIPYSDAMDFFYIWLRRTLHGLSSEIDEVFSASLAPKWDHEADDGELIDDASRFEGDRTRSKATYEDGMARVFENCYRALASEGRMVVVFANKQPAAWETLTSAVIRAGFVVTGSWPIETEMGNRTRSMESAALASSVWLVCRKRPRAARPGWDTRVLAEMRERITERLRAFWDAGIRGPDFVWAATGPAMEAYSQHPVVKKADAPGELLTVAEFLRHVRRIVVDFVVGRVLSGEGDRAITGLDDVTTYYLLHRHDFGMEPADAGAAILYAISCNLSDSDLVDRHHLLDKRGSKLRLIPWTQRKDVGHDPVLEAATSHGAEAQPLPGFEQPAPALKALPLIDQAHRLLHLWRAGDVAQVDAYLDARALRHNPLFHQLLQALIELAPAGSEERSLLESLSNHLGARGEKIKGLFT